MSLTLSLVLAIPKVDTDMIQLIELTLNKQNRNIQKKLSGWNRKVTNKKHIVESKLKLFLI